MSDYKDFKNSLLGLFANDLEFRKELPEVFEEFADARKNSFLAIKGVIGRKRKIMNPLEVNYGELELGIIHLQEK